MQNGITFTLTFISICIMLLSCGVEQQDSLVSEQGEKAAVKNLASLNVQDYEHEIDSIDAQKYIDDYKVFNDQIINSNEKEYPNIQEQLVLGSKVDLEELLEILSRAQEGDELFAMNAMMPEKNSEIIFQLHSVSDDRWYYFDFTQPCPNACPNIK